MSLFRTEAINHRQQRLYGKVLLIPKWSHSNITIVLLVWVICVIVWLANSTYARKETVSGWLEPPAGVLRVYTDIPGTIEKILITEGANIEKDQPLIVVQSQETLNSGEQLSAQMIKEYLAKQNLIDEQITSTKKIYSSRNDDLSKRISAAQQESSMLDEQLETLNERYVLISTQANRLKALMKDGHVSSAEYDNVIGQELELKNEKQSLLRSQIVQKNAIEQLQNEKKSLPDESANALSKLQEKRSDISQEMTHVNGNSGRIIKAARAGIVNNLLARQGQQVVPNEGLLLTIIPEDAQLTANLLIPVRSAGFLEIGQQIDVRYDAFPYQKFGLYQAEIEQVSKTILLPNDLANVPVVAQEPVYRITAKLKQVNVQAYGRDFPLKPGMTLSADIKLSDRTLFQWLLEPLYSLKGRL